MAASPSHGDGDDRLHDRLHLRDDDPAGSAPFRHGGAVDGHRLRPRDGGLHRARRPARGHLGAQAHRRDRDHPVRRRLDSVRTHAGHLDRGAVADHVPGAPGDRRGAADPVDHGARPQLVPPRGAGQGAGDLLHRRRAVHGGRPDRRLLPDAVLDLAGDLLDQHSSCAALTDRVRVREAQGRQAPGADRLGRRRALRGRHGVNRARDYRSPAPGAGAASRRSGRSSPAS